MWIRKQDLTNCGLTIGSKLCNLKTFTNLSCVYFIFFTDKGKRIPKNHKLTRVDKDRMYVSQLEKGARNRRCMLIGPKRNEMNLGPHFTSQRCNFQKNAQKSSGKPKTRKSLNTQATIRNYNHNNNNIEITNSV